MTLEASRLLVIDDDLNALSTWRRILTLEGHEVVAASSGRHALELLQGEKFRLILTDLRMPDISGLEVLAEALARAPQVPVVVFTAFGSSASEVAARRLGAVEFVDRTWDPEWLTETVARHLSVTARDSKETQNFAGPATKRWVSIVVSVTHSAHDVPTEREWAQRTEKSVTTLKRWCAASGVRASDSLDFARALRVCVRYESREKDITVSCSDGKCNWYNVLAIAESSTMKLFLERAGFRIGESACPTNEFLQRQRFILDPLLVSAVLDAVTIA